MTQAPSPYPSLAFNLRVDAVVMGGGITGITAAYLIKKAGCTVALVEPQRCAMSGAGWPTVHATAVPHGGMAKLVDGLGPETAKAVWEAGFAAIARIRANVRDERINCQFGWASVCRYGSPATEPSVARAALWREATIAASLGIDVVELDTIRGLGAPGLLFEGQARFQTASYLTVLADRIPGGGSYVFEDTVIDAVDGHRPFIIRCGDYRRTADHLVVTTPLAGLAVRGLALTALAARVRTVHRAVASGTTDRSDLAEGLYWEHGATAGESLIVERSQPRLDVRLEGMRDAAGRDASAGLARRLCERVPGVRLTHRWSGPSEEPVDDLPYIGAFAPRQFVAAGLGPNEATFGTLAGMMAADAVSGKISPWRDRFSVDRGARAREASLPAASSA
jgi:glycine/D-amino acid oxidase-like deaminating enzyme